MTASAVTMLDVPVSRRLRRAARALAATAILLVVGALSAAPAHSAFGIADFKGSVVDQDGNPYTQAAGHPFAVSTTISLNTAGPDVFGGESVDGQLRDVAINLPAGFVGDPRSLPQCSDDLLFEPTDPDTQFGLFAACPVNTQIGVANIRSGSTGNPEILSEMKVPIYNVEPAADEPARFAFNFSKVVVTAVPELRSGDDYGVTVRVKDVNQLLPVREVTMTLWGTPGDPAHDLERGDNCSIVVPFCFIDAGGPFGISTGSDSVSTGLPPAAFLASPTNCSAGPLTTSLEARGWSGEIDTASFDTDADHGNVPIAVDNCEAVPFSPSVSFEPTTLTPDSPTGLDVKLSVPQSTNPDAIASAHVKRVEVDLPAGMAVNASSAAGLGACSPAQIGLDDASSPSCPPSSKIGTVTVDTPLLEEPLEGEVFVAEQGTNPFKSLLALYLVAEGRGVVVKLPGKVSPDPATGQLRTTFDNNPQLPFGELRLRLKDGPRAPLVTPARCGTYTIASEVSPWSAVDPDNPTDDETVHQTDSFTIACPDASERFSPTFVAGTTNPLAGAFSPFAMRVARDGGKRLSRINVTMPKGLVAKLKDVEVCGEAQLAAATGRSGRLTQSSPACPIASQVGTTTVGAGAGSSPFYPMLPGTDVSGRVFLTGPHTASGSQLPGARRVDYGLAIEVPAVAGPFDLGTVLVRAAIFADPRTAQLTVLSDPMPTILEGIPLNVRDVRVAIDRDRFTVNPTSCAEQRVVGDLRAVDGTRAERDTRFQVGDCSRLGLTPRIGMRATGRGQTGQGDHPALRTLLRQPPGQSNIKRVQVKLPRSLVLDPKNANNEGLLCSYEQGLASSCPASSVIGRASAVSPLLKRPLRGDVHFVQGIRIDERTGNRIRTLPTLLIKLRGEAEIDLRARSNVSRDGRLVTTFAAVPDAQVSSFRLNLAGGARRGILTVSGRPSLCRGPQTASVSFRGQNGKLHRQSVRLRTPCAKSARRGR